MDLAAIDDALHLRVLAVDALTIDRSWASRDVCSPFWRFYRNAEDGAELILADGRRHPLSAGRFHLVPAWTVFTCRNARPLRHFYAHIDLGACRR